MGQKPAHKDLGRNGQRPAITPKAAYAPVSNRPSSRSDLNAFSGPETWLVHALCAIAFLRVQ
ncbi:hypothetical protein CHT97_11350 [Lacticaseibacillus chiayiensis]|nr:hypothetical protein CHT97_11350 [Lacticaseibacillus chiayiensis]